MPPKNSNTKEKKILVAQSASSSVSPQTNHSLKMFSYEFAYSKLDILQRLGFQLIGALPDPECEVKIERMRGQFQMKFLFTRGQEYFAYNARDFLHVSMPDIEHDLKKDGAHYFHKVGEQNYIFAVIKLHGQYILRLRENVEKPGHGFIIGPNFKKNPNVEVVAAGEIYFCDSKLRLITPKSGSYPFNKAVVKSKSLPAIVQMFGANAQKAFKHLITQEDIRNEFEEKSKQNESLTDAFASKNINETHLFFRPLAPGGYGEDAKIHITELETKHDLDAPVTDQAKARQAQSLFQPSNPNETDSTVKANRCCVLL